MKSSLLVNCMLLFIALMWGFGFVPQREGMNYIGPLAFNGLRFALGALTVLPILLLSRSARSTMNSHTILMGMPLGLLLFGGATFQQISIQYTSLANVAFISGLYVVIVPAIGYFFGFRYQALVWLGVVTAVIGLYLMTGSSSELRLTGDLLALVGAVFWAVHLLVLARKAQDCPQLLLAFSQFVVCALASLLCANWLEAQLLPDDLNGWLWIALNGVIVVGVAYTLQVVVMQWADPLTASLIFALESVFGGLAGYLVYHEQMTLVAFVGAIMMLLGCVLVQLPKTHKT